jgi:hypothetical protein
MTTSRNKPPRKTRCDPLSANSEKGSAFANLPLSVGKAYVLAALLSGLDYV